MISGDERREVAERLRWLASKQGTYKGVLVSDVLVQLRLLSVDHQGFMPRKSVARLADFIDPTCEMTPQGEGFRCSACGTHHDMSGFEEFPWPRCPECGARVKGSNSMPLGGEGR